MKNKHRKLLLLFLTFPFLTALYNGPHFYDHGYDNYDLTYVSHEQIDDQYVYTFDIKNNGGGYIYSVKLKGEIEEENYNLSINSFSDTFCDYVLGPGVKTTVKVTTSKEIPDISKLKKTSEAYTISDSSINKHYFSSDYVENITLEDDGSSNPNHVLIYKVNFKEGTNTNFGCGVFEYTYSEEKVYLMKDRSQEGWRIYTYQEIDLTKLKYEGATLIEDYRVFSPTGEGIALVSLMAIGVILLIHGAIFCAVFFPVRYLIRKNRKAKADLAQ